MNNNYNCNAGIYVKPELKHNNGKRSLSEIREKKRVLMILKEINEELFDERGCNTIPRIRHSAR